MKEEMKERNENKSKVRRRKKRKVKEKMKERNEYKSKVGRRKI